MVVLVQSTVVDDELLILKATGNFSYNKCTDTFENITKNSCMYHIKEWETKLHKKTSIHSLEV